MRPLWKGAISFGLVNVPVKLYPATESQDLKFNYLHSRCQTPIQYRKYCPHCRAEVPPEEIVRGYEYEKGRYVIIREEDLAGIPADTTHSINIMDFVDLPEIDPVYFARSYYLVPGEMGQKPYTLLRQAMAETGKVAIARVTLRTRESLAAVRVYGPALVINTMFYPAEVRAISALPELDFQVDLHANEVKMAVTLIKSLATSFQPEKYTDTYRQDLMKVIEAKIAGDEVAVPARPEAGKVVDLMEALKASIELAKKEKEGVTAGTAADKPRRRRKTS
ncbi:Ku protein [Moorella sp. Hama-1]|uniref:non-homologous end joining protein Ku n=1 Tax=Moorella sp. Hama-1 TaxID=2138101 RepID=UPI000D6502BF|nr:Ku protein [Moorella sp. Hama-1]BCV21743.1 non-homologous end joining protein Ku [Moorella sp. Hama-1]